ncbi:hypothetical protein OIU84_017366 [Salix udensis]|uniref:beta-galactosidase n=1 Tax=Salix udensis TaxID=889485 RepID=A0AAD6L3D3_9ROSI|nr:hypothetical protein OIU84_017366 [Salix udensis]
MWPSLIAKAKEGGLDAIETYVFWNAHEPQPGHYDFSGRHDIVSFIKEVHAQGLYACLRIGPFIQSEWSYGGLPFWLHDIPGIVFRSDNEPFKVYMQNFTAKIVSMMKSENLYASQGGPIILSQVQFAMKLCEYQVYGEDAPVRSAEDIAFHVTLFIAAKKGSFVNYYMYHGGTKFRKDSICICNN